MSFRKKQKQPTYPLLEIGDIEPNVEKEQILTLNIDEIKSMRDEINWRVKIAYNSSIIFLSGISIIIGSLFTNDNKFLESVKSDPDTMTLCGLGILIAISAWVGVQNANHLIEKRIELYTLELLKVVYKKNNHLYCGWLGYLYGNTFFKNNYKQFTAKFLNASIGMFIYLLPNIVAIGVWVYVFNHGLVTKYIIFFLSCTIFLLVAVGSTFLFFFYVVKVNKNFSDFYKKIMVPYFEKNGVKY